MISKIKGKAKAWLLWSEKYAQADMFYIASNSFWTSLNFGITSIFSLALIFFFANFLSKETYGNYRYVMSISGALGFLTLSGMSTAVTQAVARGHDGILRYAVKLQLKWNMLFLAASSLVGAYYIANDNSVVGLSILILGLSFPFISAFSTFGDFMSGKKEFKLIAIWGIATNIIYTSSMILAIIFGKSVLVLVIVYSLSNLVVSGFLYLKTIKIFNPPHQKQTEEKNLLNYGFHLSLVNVFGTVSQYVDKVLVFHYLGAVQLAVYGLALAIPERIRGYTKSLNSIVLPKLSGKEISNIRPVFYKRILQGMAVGALISLVYILLSPYVFKFFLPKYLESIRYSQAISLYFIANLPLSYIASIFRSQKMLRAIYLSSTVFAISKITLFVILGALWGVWGIVLASLIGYFGGLVYYIALWEFESRKHSQLLDPVL
jgi:O-antigen/teichoic acid export membrane protein